MNGSNGKESKKYLQDLRDWQDKQYLPGAYTGSDMPFPVKQFGKKKWFRGITIIYLALFFALLIFALVQMVLFISKQ